MKKIYTLAKVLILSAIFCSETSAQCPDGRVFPVIHTDLNTGVVTCLAFVRTPYPNSSVTVYSGAENINIGFAPLHPGNLYKTDAVGEVTVYIQCNKPVTSVLIVEPTTQTHEISDPVGTPPGAGCIADAVFAATPIKLKSFNATLSAATTVELKWTSSQEKNSLQFVVEKSSDGKNFTGIGTVAAAGESVTDKTYGFQDKQFSSSSFYRLKMVDIDGKSEYSKVVYVNGKGGTTTLSVFPNPFKSDVQLKGISTSEVNKQNIKVFNVAGKQVGYRVTGANSIAIDANLPQGVYILRVKDQTYKLIKE